MLELLRRIVRAYRNRYSSPAEYWDRRYARKGSALAAPGCIDLDEAANVADYEEKWRHLEAALGRLELGRGARILEAGCGNGAMTMRLVGSGYAVTAVDFSRAAIAVAKARGLSEVEWVHGSLDGFRSTVRFDAAVCIDVVHHVVDDGVLERSLANILDHLRPGASLLLQTHFPDASEAAAQTSAHVRFRSRDEIAAMLPAGGSITQRESYHLPGEQRTKEIWTVTRG
jgi:2-polyprenyl-3-methyl-5-hydroxy-6-metoxy-1,4-benzoquinol methylase